MSLTQAIFAALNIAYEEEERRSLVRFYLSAFIFAILGIFSGVLMLLAIVYVPILFAYAGYSTVRALVAIARWPLLALVVLIFLAALYRYGPCRAEPKWGWVSAGSVFATALWLSPRRAFRSMCALRQLRQNLRLARRGGRAAVLALSLLLHRAARRRDQRRARIADLARTPRKARRSRWASAALSSPTMWRQARKRPKRRRRPEKADPHATNRSVMRERAARR